MENEKNQDHIEMALFRAGPLHPYRLKIEKMLKDLPVKTGDILFRLDGYVFWGLFNFSETVCTLTKSNFDHAAVVYVENEIPMVVEISDQGCTLFRLVDWADYVFASTFSVYRLKTGLDTDANIAKLQESVKTLIASDPDYDFSFGNENGKFYCTEFVAKVYEDAGLPLMKPMLIKDIMGGGWRYWLFYAINKLAGKITGMCFNAETPMYFVGNNKQGMMSSPLISLMAKISF
jgi:hypothetical protein